MPTPCFICGATIRQYTPICEHCWHQLPWHRRHCRSCPQPRHCRTTRHCKQCSRTPTPWQALYVPFQYKGIIKHSITQFKYQQQHWLGNWLAGLLHQHLALQKNMAWPDALLPVPIHTQRLRYRGFNQALLIAKTLSYRLGIPIHDACVRITATAPQHSMDKTQRAYNLKQAFQATRPCPAHIAIIDDIYTTGSTMHALTQQLMGHGAHTVALWCIATSNG